jgi:hypothetical protein
VSSEPLVDDGFAIADDCLVAINHHVDPGSTFPKGVDGQRTRLTMKEQVKRPIGYSLLETKKSLLHLEGY